MRTEAVVVMEGVAVAEEDNGVLGRLLLCVWRSCVSAPEEEEDFFLRDKRVDPRLVPSEEVLWCISDAAISVMGDLRVRWGERVARGETARVSDDAIFAYALCNDRNWSMSLPSMPL